MFKGLVALGIVVIVVWVGRRLLGRSSPKRSPERTPSANLSALLPPSTAKQNWLIGTTGSVAGKTFHIGARSVTIGRGVSNFVQITDTDASRVHCQLLPIPRGLQVKDMGSKNGTQVNGELISQTVLRDGDELAIGTTRFRFSQFGRFGVNSGLEKKTVGWQESSATVAMAPEINVASLARQAIADTDGDIDAAAARMGISPSMLLSLLK